MLQDLKNPMTDEPFISPIDDEAYEAILRAIARVFKSVGTDGWFSVKRAFRFSTSTRGHWNRRCLHPDLSGGGVPTRRGVGCPTPLVSE